MNPKFSAKHIGPSFVMLLLILGSCNMWTFNPNKTYDEAKEMQRPYDAVIVPGVPLEGEDWSQIMQARVYWSYHLYQEGITKNIIYSGSAVYTPYIESKVMALYAKELGMPGENIYMEKCAEHSTENLYYSYQLAKELGFEKVALATDPFQTFMLTSTIKTGLQYKVGIVPIVFPMVSKMDKKTPDIDRKKAHVDNFTSIEEREKPLERFMGTLGFKINYKGKENGDKKPCRQHVSHSLSQKEDDRQDDSKSKSN
jgi:hypothetical protein